MVETCVTYGGLGDGDNTSLEDIAATEFNGMFSGTQPRQEVKNLRRFRDCPRPYFQVVADGLAEPKLIVIGFGCTESSATF